MSNKVNYTKIIHRILALVAGLFGLATIFAGGRVLAGSDPGYIVFRPLLIYNTIMGVVYIAAAVVIWYKPDKGKFAAAAIFAFNLLVLGAIIYLFTSGSAIAVNSLQAMTFRTIVWLVIFVGLGWIGRKRA